MGCGRGELTFTKCLSLYDLRPGSRSSRSMETGRRNREWHVEILMLAICLVPLEVFEAKGVKEGMVR